MSKLSIFILVIFSIDVLVLTEEILDDREKRKEIVKNYLETLKTENDWVDPYDMLSHKEELSGEPNTDNAYKPVFSDIRGEVIDSNAVTKDNTDVVIKDAGKLFPSSKHQLCILDSIYISRWLKMLILKIETDSYFEPNALNIPLNSETLSDLKTISTKTINIGELDELVSNLISKTIVTSKETYDWVNFGYILLFILLCGLVLYFLYFLFIYRPIWIIFGGIILICICWHWMHLYQKKVANKHAQLASMQIPSECRKNDFGFIEAISEYFISLFRVSDCSKYYEALMVDPFWEVSLSVAISEALSAFILQPMYPITKALNISIKQLFDGLSLTSSLIVVLFSFIVILMFFNYRIKFPFFMGVLEPGYNQRNYVEDVKPNKSFGAVSDLIQKSVENIETADRKTADLFQKKLLHKDVNSDSSVRKKCKNVICKECEKSLKFDSIEYLADQQSKVGKELKSANFCKKCVADDKSHSEKNCMFAENDKCDSLASSYNSKPIELSDVDEDEFVENSCFACKSDEQRQNACYSATEQYNA